MSKTTQPRRSAPGPHPAVPVRRDRPQGAGEEEGRGRCDLARHRRPRPADARPHRQRAAGGGGRPGQPQVPVLLRPDRAPRGDRGLVPRSASTSASTRRPRSCRRSARRTASATRRSRSSIRATSCWPRIPATPPYATGAIMAGADPYVMPLTAANHWLPDLDAIPDDVASRARLMWLNYPNNPTAAVAGREFLEKAVEFCRRHDIVLCHDAPYSEICFDGYRPLSLFEIPGAKDVGLEFHSLSKTFNMTGWRIGWVCGRADLVGLIGQLKTNIDSGIFQAVQWAAIEALNGGEEETRAANEIYARRHRLVADTLNSLGWSIKPPRATFYVWAPVPDGYDSIGFRRPRAGPGRREHHAGRRFWRARRGLFQAVGDGSRRPPRGGDGALEEAQALITTRTPRERAYLVGVLLPGTTAESVGDQMTELADLTRTAGAEVVGTDIQTTEWGGPCSFHRDGQGRRAAGDAARRRLRRRHLQRRPQPPPAAQPRARAEGAGARSDRGDPRHLRAARANPRRTPPGRSGAASPHAAAPDRLVRLRPPGGRPARWGGGERRRRRAADRGGAAPDPQADARPGAGDRAGALAAPPAAHRPAASTSWRRRRSSATRTRASRRC